MQDNSVTEFQQLWGGWTTLVNRLYEDPKVSHLMNTRLGLYLRDRPVLALTALMFSAICALPVGLFLTFAIVTFIMSAVGFIFVEGFLLFVAGLALLSVLSGVALFSLVVSFISHVLYFTISSIIKSSYPHFTKLKSQVQKTETSETKATQ